MPQPAARSEVGLASVANTADSSRNTAKLHTTLSTSSPDNTAAKGPDLSGVDPVTGAIEILFHPRRDRWAGHFEFRGVLIDGLTPSGRVTVEVLALNDARRLEIRQELLLLGELA
jgi:hypothetical protein